MKSGTENKLKFKQLQRRLDLPLWQARGLLDTLWSFVALNCPSGDIGRFSDEEIATGIDWRGNVAELIAALLASRWIDADQDPQVRLVVHDWPDHCESSVHNALARAVELFADGTMPNLSRIEKKDRPQILKQYELKYGREVAIKGRQERNAAERRKTPENALPLLSSPLQAKPLPSVPSSTCETASIDVINADFDLAAGDRSDGRTVGFLDSWREVADMLADMGAVRSMQAAKACRDQGCTPQHAKDLIAHGKATGYAVQAIVYRLKIARPKLKVADGWPAKQPEPQAKTADPKADEEQIDSLLRQIIKPLQRAGKTDAEIRQIVEGRKLPWPSWADRSAVQTSNPTHSAP